MYNFTCAMLRADLPAYTVRKEKSTKGDAFYWYAYRKSGGKLAKCYVGLDHDLTVDNLEAIAQKLSDKLQRKVTGTFSVTNEVVTDNFGKVGELEAELGASRQCDACGGRSHRATPPDYQAI
ncbi:MAG: hypothetical protein ACYTX0_52445, partial [Nostoc sp.]